MMTQEFHFLSTFIDNAKKKGYICISSMYNSFVTNQLSNE